MLALEGLDSHNGSNMKDLSPYLIQEFATIKESMKKLDLGITKVLLVIDDQEHLKGTLTDGDVRRHLLKGSSIENNIHDVFNRTPITLKAKHFTMDIARILTIENKIDLLPILDDDNKIVDFLNRGDLFNESNMIKKQEGKIDVPVVIMAGGKGTRMEPFTKILPKPLIPIGDTPIVEVILDAFAAQGSTEHYLTINFRGEMIEAYFNHTPKDYHIEYIREKDFLGTAGCLTLLKDRINGTFIVSNCDVIVKANYHDVICHHREQNAILTVLSSIQHYKIPYGIVHFKEGGLVTDIQEKPEYSFTINTGIYVLEHEALDWIPEGEMFHMTDLMDRLIKAGKTVVTYPVNENEYVDIGQWEEYKKAMDKLQMLR